MFGHATDVRALAACFGRHPASWAPCYEDCSCATKFEAAFYDANLAGRHMAETQSRGKS